MDPRPFSLHELFYMAEGRIKSIASGIAKAFGPDGEPQKVLKGHKIVNPGDLIALVKASEARNNG